jgi:hypothetical protein
MSMSIVDAAYVAVARAVRSMTALGSNLTELVLGEVGKVGRVGRSHC